LALIKEIIARLRGESITVGVDVGHYAIKVAVIEHTQKGNRLLGAGVHKLDPGVILEGDVQDSRRADLINGLIALLKRTLPDGVKANIVTGINWTQGVVSDRVILRLDKDADIETAILADASNRPPFDEDNITLDYEILKKDEGSHSVLLVAVKNSVLRRWAEFYKDADLSIVAMDADAIAGVNLVLYSLDPIQLQDRAVGVLNLGDKKSHLTMLKSGLFHNVRELQNGSFDSFSLTVSRHLSVNKSEAAQILRGERSEGIDKARLEEAMDRLTDDLSVSVDLALQYYRSVEKQEEVKHIYLIGGAASIDGIAQLLSEKIKQNEESIPVTILDPLHKLNYDQKHFGGEIPSEVSAMLSVAIGRALRKV
jgi:type IV pilus assembly protein PilM